MWVRVAATASLVGLPVYVMAVNEPIMRPSSEEVLLCEPQSEAGIQLEHYNSYHNQREKHGWQLSASSDPQPYIIHCPIYSNVKKMMT